MTVAKCVLQMCLQGCLQRVRLLVDSVLYCFQKTICLWFRVSLLGFPVVNSWFRVPSFKFPCSVCGSESLLSSFSVICAVLWFRVTFGKFLCCTQLAVAGGCFWCQSTMVPRPSCVLWIHVLRCFMTSVLGLRLVCCSGQRVRCTSGSLLPASRCRGP